MAYLARAGCAAGVLAIVAGFANPGARSQQAPKELIRKTDIAIQGEMFRINGQPTYKGRMWNGKKIEGLLLNSRKVQAIFDDLNPTTVKLWAYSDTKKWDPERNTREFIAAMPAWRRHGLLGITLNLQGGSPQGYSQKQPWHNSAFKEDGSLRADYMNRLERVLDKADELGMVIILGLFYFGQDERLKDEEAVKRGVDNAIDWLFAKGYRNVLIEVNNECNVRYDHDILKPQRVHELIDRVKKRTRAGRRFLAGTSYGGGAIPKENVVRASDFLLLHGNGVKDPARIAEMVRQTRKVSGYRPMPILFNEDDHFDFDQPENNFVVAVGEYASWGYFDYRMKDEGFDDGYQSVPVNWAAPSPRKQGFFRLLSDITGEGREAGGDAQQRLKPGGDGDDPLPAGAVGRLGTTRFRPVDHVEALAISPDGKTLASAGRDICLWDFATGKKVTRFNGDRFPSLLAFGDNGRMLISVSDPGILRFRDVVTGKIVRQISLVSDPTEWDDYASITRDGRFLAFKDTMANTVRVWDLVARKEVKRIKSANYQSGPLSISLDGKALAMGRGGIEIWDLDAGKVMQSLKLDEPSYLHRFGFSPDGKAFVSSGSHSHGTRSWDVKTGKVRVEYGLRPPESSAFAFSNDGKRLAAIGLNDDFSKTMLRMWDFSADREIWSSPIGWPCSITSLVFTPDHETLVSAGSADIIRLWDVANGKEIRKHQGGDGTPTRLVVSADARWLASSNWTDGILIWDVKARTQVARFAEASWYGVSAFSPDGQHVAYTHKDRSVRLCEAATGKEIRTFERHEKDTGNRDQHEKDVTALVFAQDGRELLISHADLTFRVRRVADGKVIREHSLESAAKIGPGMYYHHFSSDARVLFEQESYRAFDATRGRPLSVAEKPSNEFSRHFALSSDGRTFAAEDKDGALLIYEVDSGRKRLTIQREKRKEDNYGYWGPLAFSPDASLLAARSVDGKTIELWHVASGKRAHTIVDAQGGVTALAFVGTSATLATTGPDTTILLWDVSVTRRK